MKMATNTAVLWIAYLLTVACMAEARVAVQRTNLPKSVYFNNFQRVHGVNQFGGEKTGTHKAGDGVFKVIPKIHKRKLLQKRRTYKIRGMKVLGRKGGRFFKRNP